VQPTRDETRHLDFLRSQLQDGGRVPFACRPAGGTELLSRPLCPRMGVELFKPVVGCLQVGSRLDSPTAPAQELAVRQLGAGSNGRRPIVRCLTGRCQRCAVGWSTSGTRRHIDAGQLSPSASSHSHC
jgi:hypothetical protein